MNRVQSVVEANISHPVSLEVCINSFTWLSFSAVVVYWLLLGLLAKKRDFSVANAEDFMKLTLLKLKSSEQFLSSLSS
jgi:hypothetical protein